MGHADEPVETVARRRRVVPERDGPAGPATAPVRPAGLAGLQSSAGNAAVCALLASRAPGYPGGPPTAQRDITGGDPLPKLDAIRTRRLEERIPDATAPDGTLITDALRNAGDDGFVGKLQGTYRDEERDESISIINEELTSGATFADAQAAAEKRAVEFDDPNADALGRERERLKGLNEKKWYLGNAYQFTSVFFGATRQASEVTANQPVVDARKMIADRSIAAGPITKEDRTSFAAVLKKLPMLKAMLASKTRQPAGATLSAWKGGGSLADSITEDTEGMASKDQVRADIDNGDFTTRVVEADRFIKTIVEPGLLADIPAPQVVVHTKYGEFGFFSPWSWKDKNRFRAFQSGTTVHVASDEATPIIVHETGHYLEKTLPPEVWSDIARLMQTRHLAKAGDATKALPSRGTKKEGGFAGSYPATGPYTSRAYSSGDTEVMALTLEHLKHPDKTVDLIEKDPVQAALILRAIRPGEYAAFDAVRPFDKYLPG